MALQVLSGAFGSPGIVWRFWLSRYCLALLALWVLSGLELLALRVLMAQWVLFWSLFDKNGNCSRTFLCKLSNTCLFFIFKAILKKKKVIGSPGIVWRFWLSGYCLALLALRVLMAQWVLFWSLFDKNGNCSRTFLCKLSNTCLFFIFKAILRKKSSKVIGSPGIVWRFWLSGYCLALLALQVLMAQWVLFWSLFDKNGNCPRTFLCKLSNTCLFFILKSNFEKKK